MLQNFFLTLGQYRAIQLLSGQGSTCQVRSPAALCQCPFIPYTVSCYNMCPSYCCMIPLYCVDGPVSLSCELPWLPPTCPAHRGRGTKQKLKGEAKLKSQRFWQWCQQQKQQLEWQNELCLGRESRGPKLTSQRLYVVHGSPAGQIHVSMIKTNSVFYISVIFSNRQNLALLGVPLHVQVKA